MTKTYRLTYRLAYVLGITALTAAGCSDAPSRVAPPTISSNAGKDAIAAYDEDGNGALHNSELKNAPSLLLSFKKIDTDQSGDLSVEEIDGRIEAWKESRVGEMVVMCEVTLDGQPLENAKVTLEPEAFLGSNVSSGTGTTAVDGTVTISMPEDKLADPQYPGMPCGWFKIRVTSDSTDIPARYNTATTLGCEISVDAPWTLNGVIPIPMTSKSTGT